LNADLAQLPQLSEWTGWLRAAAVWHDAGKAHWAFQEGMRNSNPQLTSDTMWAKSGGSGVLRHGRRYFRHELVSALLALQDDQPFAVAYLIAAHHGRVRLSIRALPDEEQPQQSGCLFALGIHDGDKVSEVALPGVTVPASQLDLAPMRLGGENSWTAQALDLLQSLGPFRLACLEAMLRIADRRASAAEAGSVVAERR
jgi:CRISPR-associated endonuclease/helicase Cas3